jgi:hypothetical protein
MPYEATIRTIALGLLALAALWIIATAIGVRPRAIRVRHALRRSAPGTMLCGACGHPAVSLGTIESCPECGSPYALAGLDGRSTASHWAPPLFVAGVLLAGAWLLGSIWLAPRAASWANTHTIGSAQLERWQSRLALRTTMTDLDTGQPVGVVAELDRDLVGPTTAAAGSTGRPALGGTATLHLMQGAAVQDATRVWDTDPITQSAQDLWLMAQGGGGSMGGGSGATPAFPDAGAMPSPWDGLRKAASTATLRWSIGSDRWTLTDAVGGPPLRGRGLEAGVSALAGRLGFEAIRTPPDPYRPNLAESLALAALGGHTKELAPVRPDRWNRMYFGRFMVVGELTANPTRATIHPAAPIGLTAALATSASLLLVAALLFALSWRTTRRSTTART